MFRRDPAEGHFALCQTLLDARLVSRGYGTDDGVSGPDGYRSWMLACAIERSLIMQRTGSG